MNCTCGKLASISFGDAVYCGDCARERMYEKACVGPTDIHEHLPLLRLLASRCDHVTEFGMRWARGSTLAFLAAQPKTFVSWELDPVFVTDRRVNDLTHVAGRTSFQPRTGNTLEITIEKTDMLFIDTLHTGRHLLSELERHVDPKNRPVAKYLAFHDTHLFGLVGEDGGPGLRTAIRQFQRLFAFPLWQLMDAHDPAIAEAAKIGLTTADPPMMLDLTNNNGLIVLKHICADGHSKRQINGQCSDCGFRESV